LSAILRRGYPRRYADRTKFDSESGVWLTAKDYAEIRKLRKASAPVAIAQAVDEASENGDIAKEPRPTKKKRKNLEG